MLGLCCWCRCVWPGPCLLCLSQSSLFAQESANVKESFQPMKSSSFENPPNHKKLLTADARCVRTTYANAANATHTHTRNNAAKQNNTLLPLWDKMPHPSTSPITFPFLFQIVSFRKLRCGWQPNGEMCGSRTIFLYFFIFLSLSLSLLLGAMHDVQMY